MHLKSYTGPINVLVLNGEREQSETATTPAESVLPTTSASISSSGSTHITGLTSLTQQRERVAVATPGQETGTSTAAEAVESESNKNEESIRNLSLEELIQNVVEANMRIFANGIQEKTTHMATTSQGDSMPMESEDGRTAVSSEDRIEPMEVSHEGDGSKGSGGGVGASETAASEVMRATVQSIVEAVSKESREREALAAKAQGEFSCNLRCHTCTHTRAGQGAAPCLRRGTFSLFLISPVHAHVHTDMHTIYIA